jgi:hypothetical protein
VYKWVYINDLKLHINHRNTSEIIYLLLEFVGSPYLISESDSIFFETGTIEPFIFLLRLVRFWHT